MGAKHLTKQEKEAILSYHKEGYSNAEIAELIGRSDSTIGYTLARAKAATEEVKPSVREMTPREMIKALYDLGYRIEDNELVCYQRQVVKLGDVVNNG